MIPTYQWSRCRLLVIAFLGAWFVLMCIASVRAASPPATDETTHYRVTELERRMNAWEAEKVIERLARVETVVESTNRIALSSLAIMVGMMAERILRRPVKREREDTND